MRFIDLAAHGGCSKKGPARELRDLLNAVQGKFAGSHLEDISKNFPDTGVYALDGMTMLSSLDIVLPMTLSPSDFGRVTVAHVLSDIYASGGVPLFALCILGIPGGMSASSKEAVEVMAAAAQQLSEESTALVGGHTMTDQEDFYLGFSVVGKPIGPVPFAQTGAKPGDSLILTKPLGTSIATARWKLNQATETDHQDVLSGMLHSNKMAARFLSQFDLHACTDVTGYGLLGHLYNILFASGVSAQISASKIPCYPSVSRVVDPSQTRQFWYNRDYVKRDLTFSTSASVLLETLLFDSQVSGGLLISVRPEDTDQILSGLRQVEFSPSCVGTVCDGVPGAIELIG